MLNFDFLEKGLGIISPPYFVYDFSRKIFLKSYFGISGNLVVKSKLPPPKWLCSLEAVEPHP